MLIPALLAAAVFYVLAFFMWDAGTSDFGSVTGYMNMMDRMMFYPQHPIFIILRGLILITAFYVFADSIVSTSKRRAAKRKRDAEYIALHKKRPSK